MSESTKVGDVEVEADGEAVTLWINNYDGFVRVDPGQAVSLSRALVKAAAEALGVAV